MDRNKRKEYYMYELLSLDNLSLRSYSKEILDINEISREYGLVLTAEDAKELSETRSRAISENDRLEIGVGALPEIMKMFCKSRYVNSENYAYILNEVTYLFYYIKTETDDKITDADLLKELFERFELQCRGSIDTLEGREAERIIRKVNSGENYQQWFEERDELFIKTDGGLNVDRDTPGDVIGDTYDNEYFDMQEIADHDHYENDVFDGVYEEAEKGFDFDTFDDMRNAAVLDISQFEIQADVASEYPDDDGEEQND